LQTAWNHPDPILDQCISAMREHNRSIEDCLAAYPARSSELEPLLRLAVRLQAAQTLQAPLATRADVLKKLQERAASRKPSPRRGQTSVIPGLRWPAWPRVGLVPLLAALLLVVIVASGLGVVAASAQALPGDFLYPVKRAQENVALTFAGDEVTRAGLRLEYAGRRIDEAVALAGQDRAADASGPLDDYNTLIQNELDSLTGSAGLTAAQQAALADRLLSDVARYQNSLSTLSQTAPQSVQGNLNTAMTASQNIQNQARTILKNSGGQQPVSPSATPTPTPRSPGGSITGGSPHTPTLPPVQTPAPNDNKPTPTRPPVSAYPPPAPSTPGSSTAPSITPRPNSNPIATLKATLTPGAILTKWATLTVKPSFPTRTATPTSQTPNTGSFPTRTRTPPASSIHP